MSCKKFFEIHQIKIEAFIDIVVGGLKTSGAEFHEWASIYYFFEIHQNLTDALLNMASRISWKFFMKEHQKILEIRQNFTKAFPDVVVSGSVP
jgi:hypothetical protein